MKLIIEIRQDFYEQLLNDVENADNSGVMVGVLERVIANGTPLPKGHGRIVDIDAIKYISAPIAPVIKGDNVHYELVAFAEDISKLPAIIKEDKDGE